MNNGVPRTWQNIIDGKVEPIAGFTILPSLALPTGVSGIACTPDALLVGSRVIHPDSKNVEFEQFNDPIFDIYLAPIPHLSHTTIVLQPFRINAKTPANLVFTGVSE